MKCHNKLLIVTDLKRLMRWFMRAKIAFDNVFLYLLKMFIILEDGERVWVLYKFIKSKSGSVITLLVMQAH